MQNINPPHNLTRRARFYLFLGFLAFFGGGIAIALFVLFNYVPLWESFAFKLLEWLLFFGGLVGLGIGGFGIFRSLTLQRDNPHALLVGEVLRQFITDNRYVFLRNVSKRSVGYIDAVLIGPPGALVFRTVDHNGIWKNERAEWMVETKKGTLRRAPDNPTRECARDVYALRKYLTKKGLGQVPVYGIVVFTGQHVRLFADGPVIPISEAHTLYQIMNRDYLKDERIAPPTIRKAVDAIIDG
jgi:hypothetical protein